MIYLFENINQILDYVIPFLERQVKMMHTHSLLCTFEKNVDYASAIKLDMCTFTRF